MSAPYIVVDEPFDSLAEAIDDLKDQLLSNEGRYMEDLLSSVDQAAPGPDPFVAAPLGSSDAEGTEDDPMSIKGNAQASSSAATRSSADPGECDSVSYRHDTDDLTQQPVLSKGKRKREAEDVVEDVAEDAPPAKRAAVAVAAGNKENLQYPGEIEELDDIDWEHTAPTWAGEPIPRMSGKDVLCYLRRRYGFNDTRDAVRCRIDGCKETEREPPAGKDALQHQEEVYTMWVLRFRCESEALSFTSWGSVLLQHSIEELGCFYNIQNSILGHILCVLDSALLVPFCDCLDSSSKVTHLSVRLNMYDMPVILRWINETVGLSLRMTCTMSHGEFSWELAGCWTDGRGHGDQAFPALPVAPDDYVFLLFASSHTLQDTSLLYSRTLAKMSYNYDTIFDAFAPLSPSSRTDTALSDFIEELPRGTMGPAARSGPTDPTTSPSAVAPPTGLPFPELPAIWPAAFAQPWTGEDIATQFIPPFSPSIPLGELEDPIEVFTRMITISPTTDTHPAAMPTFSSGFATDFFAFSAAPSPSYTFPAFPVIPDDYLYQQADPVPAPLPPEPAVGAAPPTLVLPDVIGSLVWESPDTVKTYIWDGYQLPPMPVIGAI
ncbi:hypothetical protein C8Q74DRAFT_1368164 [Fomes fomentarius]|nr:hypothetical protein C8Q74DRAFT_1368164 [Fomes fomentarius]